MVLHLLTKPKENTILSLYNSVQGQVATHRATGTFGNKKFLWWGNMFTWLSKNDIYVCGAKKRFFKNTEKMTFTILDVYPPKIDRMKMLSIPGDREFQRASFGTRFGCHSLSKTYSFSWNTEFCFSNVLDVYPSKIDRFWEFVAPFCSSRPCASFCFLIYFSHPLKINTFFKKKHKRHTLFSPKGPCQVLLGRRTLIF